jgi:hypothetical protein
MAKKSTSTTTNTEASTPRSLAIAERGVNTGPEFASLMSAMMTDLIAGTITPNIANATCNAAGKLLKVVEMQHKYGKAGQPAPENVLKLTG